MADAATATRESAPSPAAAVAYLIEVSPEMRGCAILGRGGSLLAASDDGPRWGEAASEVVAAVDAAGVEPVSHAHVATAEGELFMVREGELVAIAATDRFTLASLVLFDLRAALRDLARGASG